MEKTHWRREQTYISQSPDFIRARDVFKALVRLTAINKLSTYYKLFNGKDLHLTDIRRLEKHCQEAKQAILNFEIQLNILKKSNFNQ